MALGYKSQSRFVYSLRRHPEDSGVLGWRTERRCRVRLRVGDGDAGQEGVIHPVHGNCIATLIHHCDNHGYMDDLCHFFAFFNHLQGFF